MAFTLVVVRAFGGHAPGDSIDDPDTIRDILGGEHAGHVVRVARQEG